MKIQQFTELPAVSETSQPGRRRWIKNKQAAAIRNFFATLDAYRK